ncbi:hypothetical protein IU487_22405 [Nocardia puris]|uniref:hypothetical protein n=1 Tax=Nocardia puris TaxID=208602 RepID=UPI001894686D|nr:hypothetical protein [Nocardia puris]MBF6213773.1 hypothetical protein [Nocardia puris]
MAAFREIRTLEETKTMLHDFAKAGAREGGDGFVARANTGRNRARAAVIAAHPKARHRNANEHTLVGPVIDAMKEHGR